MLLNYTHSCPIDLLPIHPRSPRAVNQKKVVAIRSVRQCQGDLDLASSRAPGCDPGGHLRAEGRVRFNARGDKNRPLYYSSPIHHAYQKRFECWERAGRGYIMFFFSTSRNVGSFRTGVCVSDATAPSPPWIVVSCESPPRTGNLAR